MALLSPGVQVSVIDQSNYTPAAAGSTPYLLIVTAENKISGAGTGIAPGTLAANANVHRVHQTRRQTAREVRLWRLVHTVFLYQLIHPSTPRHHLAVGLHVPLHYGAVYDLPKVGAVVDEQLLALPKMRRNRLRDKERGATHLFNRIFRDKRNNGNFLLVVPNDVRAHVVLTGWVLPLVVDEASLVACRHVLENQRRASVTRYLVAVDGKRVPAAGVGKRYMKRLRRSHHSVASFPPDFSTYSSATRSRPQ